MHIRIFIFIASHQLVIDVTCTIVEQLELQSFPFDIQPLSIVLNFERSPQTWTLVAFNDRTKLIRLLGIQCAGGVDTCTAAV